MMVKWYKVTGLHGWRDYQCKFSCQMHSTSKWVTAIGDPLQDDLALVQIFAEDEHGCDAEMRSQMDDGLFENARYARDEAINDLDMIGWLNSAWELYQKNGVMSLGDDDLCITGTHYVERLARYLRDKIAQYREAFAV